MIKRDSILVRSIQVRFVTFVRSSYSFIGLLIVILFFTVATNGDILGSRNLMNIFNNTFSIGLGAMGIMFLMSLGELDLSVGAIAGISAALAALAAQISTAFILPVAIVTGFAVGSVNGLLISRLRIGSFIGTLAMSFVIRGVTIWLLDGSVGIPMSQRFYDQDFIKITVFVVLLIGLFILYEYKPFGKHCRAIGASDNAARQSGVRVERVRTLAFMISGVMCGLVGFFSLVRTLTASSRTGSAYEFDVLLAVLLGGMSLTGGWVVKFRAAVLGSITMAFLKNGMSLMGIDGLTQQLIQGVLLIIIVSITFNRKSAGIIR